jgi:glycosyltransferase involved in cell wall biosynthesis
LKAPFLKINPTHLMHFHRPDFALPFIFFSNPKVCTIHGEPGELIKVTKGLTFSCLYNFFERLAIRSFKRLIFVSESALKYYQKKFPDLKEQMQVIPPAIDSYFIRQSERDRKKWREKNGWNEADKILLFIGRLEKEKQIDIIIQQFHELLQEQPHSQNFRLVIIGDGRLKESIENKLRQCADSHIHSMGFYPKSELPLIYTSVDATIIFSMSEGLPGVVLESLACGTPVVANRVGDLPLVIEHGKNGYLVDANSLKEGMSLVLENSPLMRENCITSIEKFRVEFIMNELVSIYENELVKTNK